VLVGQAALRGVGPVAGQRARRVASQRVPQAASRPTAGAARQLARRAANKAGGLLGLVGGLVAVVAAVAQVDLAMVAAPVLAVHLRGASRRHRSATGRQGPRPSLLSASPIRPVSGISLHSSTTRPSN
jgi:hypothetical protein